VLRCGRRAGRRGRLAEVQCGSSTTAGVVGNVGVVVGGNVGVFGVGGGGGVGGVFGVGDRLGGSGLARARRGAEQRGGAKGM